VHNEDASLNYKSQRNPINNKKNGKTTLTTEELKNKIKTV